MPYTETRLYNAGICAIFFASFNTFFVFALWVLLGDQKMIQVKNLQLSNSLLLVNKTAELLSFLLVSHRNRHFEIRWKQCNDIATSIGSEYALFALPVHEVTNALFDQNTRKLDFSCYECYFFSYWKIRNLDRKFLNFVPKFASISKLQPHTKLLIVWNLKSPKRRRVLPLNLGTLKEMMSSSENFGVVFLSFLNIRKTR